MSLKYLPSIWMLLTLGTSLRMLQEEIGMLGLVGNSLSPAATRALQYAIPFRMSVTAMRIYFPTMYPQTARDSGD